MPFCKFCNDEKSDDHTQVCDNCGGKSHIIGEVAVCETCGREAPVKRQVKFRPAKVDQVKEDKV